MCSTIFYYFQKNGSKKLCIKRTFGVLSVAFGEPTVSKTQVQLGYNRFKRGREEVNDNACPARLSMSTTDENIETAKKILDNRRNTIREVDDDDGI